MRRTPEPERMDLPDEVRAYAQADFADVNQCFAERLAELAGATGRRALAALDLGTGPGDIPLRVSRLRPCWRITAVDVSQPMLDVAARAIRRARLARKIRLVLADALHTGLPSGAYDILFSNSILHHVREPLALWREMRRLLRPGGLLFIRDLARPASEERVRQIVARHAGGESALLQEEFLRSLRAAYTVSEVRAQLRRAGWRGLRVALVSDRHLDVWGRP